MSRVMISRSLPSGGIVYLTLMPVSFVKSDGVSFAMSSMNGLLTIATVSVFFDLSPDPPQPAVTALMRVIAAASSASDASGRFRKGGVIILVAPFRTQGRCRQLD